MSSSKRKATTWQEHGTPQEIRQIGDLGRKAMRLRKEAAQALHERAALIRKVSDRVRHQRKRNGKSAEHALIDILTPRGK